MATPSGIGIGNLTGKWIIDKRHSTDPEAGLKLQGINWILRKAVGLATVTIHISSQDTPNDQDEVAGSALYLKILQIPTGRLAQIPEIRILDDNEATLLNDFLFGTRRSQNRLIRGEKGSHGRIVPSLTPRTPIEDTEIEKHLRGESNADEFEGSFITEGSGLWIHSFDEEQGGAWRVEQVWGFETIGGERYHTRRFVVSNKSGAFVMGRVVFSYVGP